MSDKYERLRYLNNELYSLENRIRSEFKLIFKPGEQVTFKRLNSTMTAEIVAINSDRQEVVVKSPKTGKTFGVELYEILDAAE